MRRRAGNGTGWSAGAAPTRGHWSALLGSLLGLMAPAVAAQEQQAPASDLLVGVELVTLSAEDLLVGRVENAERVLASLNDRSEAVRAMRMALERDLERNYRTRPEGTLRRQWDSEKRLLRARIDATEAKLQFYLAQRQLLRAQIDLFARESEFSRYLRSLAGGTDVGGAGDSSRAELIYLEGSVLEALELVARREEETARRRREFVERQRAVADLR